MDMSAILAANQIDPSANAGAGEGTSPHNGSVDFAKLLLNQINHFTPGASGTVLSSHALMSVMDSMVPTPAAAANPSNLQTQPAQTVAAQQSANIKGPTQPALPHASHNAQPQQSNQNTSNSQQSESASNNDNDSQNTSDQSGTQSSGGNNSDSNTADSNAQSSSTQSQPANSARGSATNSGGSRQANDSDPTDDPSNQADIIAMMIVAAPTQLPVATNSGPTAAAAAIGAVQNDGKSSGGPGKSGFAPSKNAIPTGPFDPNAEEPGQSPGPQTAAPSAASASAATGHATSGSTGSASSPIAQQQADLSAMLGPEVNAPGQSQSAFQISVATSGNTSSGLSSLSTPNLASLLPEGLSVVQEAQTPGMVQAAMNSASVSPTDELSNEDTDDADFAAAIDSSQADDANAVVSQSNTTFSSALESANQGGANPAQASGPAAVTQPNAANFAATQAAANAQSGTGNVDATTETEQTNAPQNARQATAPTAVQQIKVMIEQGLKDGNGLIKVQLTPHDLGRVEVKLDVQDGQAKATVTADRPETLQMLKNDQAGLQQALKDAGLSTDNNSISFFLRGEEQRQQAQNQQQSGNRRQRNAPGNDLTVSAIADKAAQTVSDPNSALDISV